MMKKIVITVNENDKNYNYYNTHLNTFLFQLDYKFYLIMYPSYYEGFSHLDLKEDFLKQVLELTNKSKVYFSRSNVVSNVKKDIKSGVIFKMNIDEVCHMYHDNANKEYSFNNKNTYVDYIQMQASYLQNFNAASEDIENDILLTNQDKKYLNTQLVELYHMNRSDLSWLNEYQQVQLAQLLLKSSLYNWKKKNGQGKRNSNKD